MKTVHAFWSLLPPPLRRRCLALLGLSIVMAATTVAGLVSVMPFFQLLSDSDTPTTRWLQGVRAWLGIVDERVFLGAAGAAFVLSLIVANVINYLGTRSMHAFALGAADAIRVRLFGVYLRSDYLFHTRHDGARLGNDVLHEADRVAALVNVGFQAVTATGVVMLIAASLMILNPWVSFVTLLVFGSAYALIFARSRKQLRLNSIELTRESARRATVIRQAFAAIKELLVMRLDAPFQHQFGEATTRMSRSLAHTHAIGLRPKYVLECLAAFALVTVALALHVQAGVPWLPQLTFLALSAYRLLPSLQQIFAGLVTVRAHREVLFSMLQSVEDESASGAQGSARQFQDAPMRDIVFEDVTFRYGPRLPAVFDNLNLRIRAGETIGVTGHNGSGKSSFADLLLGLLAPTSGRVLADGIDIGGRNRAAWQATVGYVPQHVALIDGTVMENIALGIAPGDVDQGRLEAAMRIARVDEFVANFPHGPRTLLGERGVQLSGGQRQRLGIARALYRRATLLVMDEATASLDVAAEREITSALLDRPKSTTLVIIAHRRTALSGCDRILHLRDGRFTSEHVECA